MHREIATPLPGHVTHHGDGRTLNNARRNLLVCTHEQNSYYQRKRRRRTSSVFKGVCLMRRNGTWIAYLRHKRKLHHLGYFSSEVEAALAYDRAARERFGQFALPNFQRFVCRRWLRRWLNATKGRIFSVYFKKRSNAAYRWMVCRTGVKRGTRGLPFRFDVRKKKLLSVFDVSKGRFRFVPLDLVEAVRFAGTNYALR
jgi:hypothetical protein